MPTEGSLKNRSGVEVKKKRLLMFDSRCNKYGVSQASYNSNVQIFGPREFAVSNVDLVDSTRLPFVLVRWFVDSQFAAGSDAAGRKCRGVHFLLLLHDASTSVDELSWQGARIFYRMFFYFGILADEHGQLGMTG